MMTFCTDLIGTPVLFKRDDIMIEGRIVLVQDGSYMPRSGMIYVAVAPSDGSEILTGIELASVRIKGVSQQ
jgi:hypothetical protein